MKGVMGNDDQDASAELTLEVKNSPETQDQKKPQVDMPPPGPDAKRPIKKTPAVKKGAVKKTKMGPAVPKGAVKEAGKAAAEGRRSGVARRTFPQYGLEDC
jgi:hypothetical protein